MKFFLLTFFVCLAFVSKLQIAAPLSWPLPATQTDVAFASNPTENDTLHLINRDNIYKGCVGISDFNNDGLPELYFAGKICST